MSEVIGTIPPQAAVFLGIVWILRETLGFLYKIIEPTLKRNQNSIIEGVIKDNITALKDVSRSIEQNTKIMERLLNSIDDTKNKINEVDKSVTRMKDMFINTMANTNC